MAARGSEIRGRFWSRDRIIEAIRLWVEEVGEPPRVSDWDQRGRHPHFVRSGRKFPTRPTVDRYFGSLGAAVKAAGFEPKMSGWREPQGPRALLEARRDRLKADLAEVELDLERLRG